MILQRPVSGLTGRSPTQPGEIMYNEAPTKQLGTGGLMDTAVTTAFARSEKTAYLKDHLLMFRRDSSSPKD